jgi:sorting nexin-8
MSLFGTPSEDSSHATSSLRPQSKPIFDDERTPGSATGSSSLFTDGAGGNGDSPWGMPTPRKGGRGDVIRNLLPATDVPESYIDAFDAIIASGSGTGNTVSLDGVTKVLEASRLDSRERSRLLKLVLPGGAETGVGRSEFNVLLALIGLAQEGEEATLDGVDERRKSPWCRLGRISLPLLMPGRATRSLGTIHRKSSSGQGVGDNRR